MAEMKVSWDFGSAVFKPWLDLNRHVYILDTSSKLGKEEKQDQEEKKNTIRWEENCKKLGGVGGGEQM